MSHFAVMVIGDNVEEQLSKYDENLEAEEYCKGEVSEDEQKMMLDYYEREKGETFSNFDECYTRYGEEWNDNCYKKILTVSGKSIVHTILFQNGIGGKSEVVSLVHLSLISKRM